MFSSPQKILIVEDDRNISKLVRYNLEKADLECLTCICGEEAFEILDQKPIDLIILDIMLPKMDGLSVCREIRNNERLKHIPIVILTAKGEEIDRVVGLELGADDYMVKPFSPRELVLRVKAILRRKKTVETKKDIVSIGDICVDIPRHKATVKDKEIELTAMEFKLLTVLMERRGRVQTRDTLLADVWGMSSEIYTRTIDTHVKRLRQKLGKAGKRIETIVGVGYKMRDDIDAD
ncbi:MAG TPA: response regulator transcription factor [Candidatus Omnitrophota bacterium]|nr:response regulator transcription factor [Candidatus Omnitrophota bacterium]